MQRISKEIQDRIIESINSFQIEENVGNFTAYYNEKLSIKITVNGRCLIYFDDNEYFPYSTELENCVKNTYFESQIEINEDTVLDILVELP